MATLVIVHGAMAGGWQWQRVRPLLRAAGHEVYTPTLTGLGERVHLAHPDIDLETHIQDVVNVLEYEDLHAVTLVGHSYSGMVITGVADRAADRLAQLVYVEALVPADGQSQLDLAGPERAEAARARARATGDGWRLPPDHIPADSPYLGLKTDADVQFYASRRVGHPFKTMEQPVRLANPAARSLPRTYIDCTASEPFRSGLYRRFLEQAQTTPGWRYRQIASGHLPNITAPRELAELLIELAENPDIDQTPA